MSNEFKEPVHEWDTLKLNEYNRFTEFACCICKSLNIEIFGANLTWNSRRSRWQIVDETEASYQCMDCHNQAELKDVQRRCNLTKLSEYVRIVKMKREKQKMSLPCYPNCHSEIGKPKMIREMREMREEINKRRK